ncbi:hypothetical protein CGRA01v4_14328 [Colletotrichum graminicola]|nr:hypothetical protein CGRA01v4_14328 [Colletotrichum graminicola]
MWRDNEHKLQFPFKYKRKVPCESSRDFPQLSKARSYIHAALPGIAVGGY